MLKTLFPLSFTKKTLHGVIIYLLIYVAGSLLKGILRTFTDLYAFSGYLTFFITIYAFIGLFILCLKHLGYIKTE